MSQKNNVLFQAFNILVSNALRVAALNSIGDFLLFLAKLAVMAATGAVGVIWLKVGNSFDAWFWSSYHHFLSLTVSEGHPYHLCKIAQ